MYLATRNGVSVFDFRTPENIIPEVIINSVTVDGVTYEHPEQITVESGARRINVNYAVLSYNTASRFDTTYELEGFDNGENPVEGAGNFVSYTNLQGANIHFACASLIPTVGKARNAGLS